MNLPSFLRGGHSIAHALRWWFILIALVPCLLLTGIMEYLTSQALDKTVRRGLTVIAEAKSAAFDAFIRERRGDAHVAGHLPFVIEATNKLGEVLKTKSLDSAEYRDAASKYSKVLSYYREAYGYENLFLFAVDGKLLLRLEAGLDAGTNLKHGPLKDSALAVSFDEVESLVSFSHRSPIIKFIPVQTPRRRSSCSRSLSRAARDDRRDSAFS